MSLCARAPWVLGVEVVEGSGFALDLEAPAALRGNAQLLLLTLQRAQRSGCGGGEGGEGGAGIIKSVGRDGRLLGIAGNSERVKLPRQKSHILVTTYLPRGHSSYK